MKKVLLAMSTSGYSPEAAEYAIQAARQQKAHLICTYIIDAEIPDAVSSWLIYIGFMGDEPSKEYRNIIQKEYKTRARETLAEVRQLAGKHNLYMESFILQGQLVAEILKLAKEIKASLIVINKPNLANFSRFLNGTNLNELKKKAPCEVKIIGE